MPECLGSKSSSSSTPVFANAELASVLEGSSNWVLVTLTEFLAPCFGAAETVVGIWGVKRQMGACSLSPSSS